MNFKLLIFAVLVVGIAIVDTEINACPTSSSVTSLAAAGGPLVRLRARLAARSVSKSVSKSKSRSSVQAPNTSVVVAAPQVLSLQAAAPSNATASSSASAGGQAGQPVVPVQQPLPEAQPIASQAQGEAVVPEDVHDFSLAQGRTGGATASSSASAGGNSSNQASVAQVAPVTVLAVTPVVAPVRNRLLGHRLRARRAGNVSVSKSFSRSMN